MKKTRNKTYPYELRLKFRTRGDLECWFAWYLDGGGEAQVGWYVDSWTNLRERRQTAKLAASESEQCPKCKWVEVGEDNTKECTNCSPDPASIRKRREALKVRSPSPEEALRSLHALRLLLLKSEIESWVKTVKLSKTKKKELSALLEKNME